MRSSRQTCASVCLFACVFLKKVQNGKLRGKLFCSLNLRLRIGKSCLCYWRACFFATIQLLGRLGEGAQGLVSVALDEKNADQCVVKKVGKLMEN